MRRSSYARWPRASHTSTASARSEATRRRPPDLFYTPLDKTSLLYQLGLPPQSSYIFKHALIRDAAYHSLLRSTRQQYHQGIARVLAEQFPDTAATQPELVAHH